MDHETRTTQGRIKSIIAVRRQAARPDIQEISNKNIVCIQEQRFGEVDVYWDWLTAQASNTSGRHPIVLLDEAALRNIVNTTPGVTGEQTVYWDVLRSLKVISQKRELKGVGLLNFFSGERTEETLSRFDLDKYRKSLKQKYDLVIVPVRMDGLADAKSIESVHHLAESLASRQEPLRILCLWGRSLDPDNNLSENITNITFPADEFELIPEAELSRFLIEVDSEFQNATNFNESFGAIWDPLFALNKVLHFEQLGRSRVAEQLSKHLFNYLHNKTVSTQGAFCRLPDMHELRKMFLAKEVPVRLSVSKLTTSELDALERAEHFRLVWKSDAASRGAAEYRVNAALHPVFQVNAIVNPLANTTSAERQDKVDANSLQVSRTSTAVPNNDEVFLPEFRAGATAASRLKTLLLLNQGRRLPFWLVAHPTMGGTSAFTVLRKKYRGLVFKTSDNESKDAAVTVLDSIRSSLTQSIDGNELDVPSRLTKLSRELFNIDNPQVDLSYAARIEQDVLRGGKSIEIMKRIFLELPGIPIWEYWLIWMLSVRLHPETVDRDLRDMVDRGDSNKTLDPKVLNGLKKIPQDNKKYLHRCEEHAKFDQTWARARGKEEVSSFLEKWSSKIPLVSKYGHTFAEGLDWYIYDPD